MNRISYYRANELITKGALLVDMRSPVAFRDGHIAGAVNLPLMNFVNKIMGLDKTKKIIIYGDSITDDVLRQGNNYAETLGFGSVFVTDYKSLKEEPAKEVKNVKAKGPKDNTKGRVLLRNSNNASKRRS